MLEKTLESHLDCKEIQPVHPKGDQSWVFIGGTDAEAENPILWPRHAKNWLIGKDPDAGRDWGQEEKGTKEDDGWMASPTRWTWVWVNSVSWWWTGRPGVLWFMGLKRVGHDWATEVNWTELNIGIMIIFSLRCYRKTQTNFFGQTNRIKLSAHGSRSIDYTYFMFLFAFCSFYLCDLLT